MPNRDSPTHRRWTRDLGRPTPTTATITAVDPSTRAAASSDKGTPLVAGVGRGLSLADWLVCRSASGGSPGRGGESVADADGERCQSDCRTATAGSDLRADRPGAASEWRSPRCSPTRRRSRRWGRRRRAPRAAMRPPAGRPVTVHGWAGPLGSPGSGSHGPRLVGDVSGARDGRPGASRNAARRGRETGTVDAVHRP
jgi:hypothetical protein